MILRKGKISSIKSDKVIVHFEEDLSSDELIFIGNDYLKPKIDEEVICIISDEIPGICMRPVKLNESNKDYVYFKALTDSISIGVNNSGALIINASQMNIEGNVHVNGNVTIDGTLSATGKITAEGTVLT